MSRKIILSGCMGRMGKAITELCQKNDDFAIIAGVDIVTGGSDFPIYKNISEISEKADVIIDFSNTASLDSLLDYAQETSTPIVLSTTGYNDDQVKKIIDAAKYIPIFFIFFKT